MVASDDSVLDFISQTENSGRRVSWGKTPAASWLASIRFWLAAVAKSLGGRDCAPGEVTGASSCGARCAELQGACPSVGSTERNAVETVARRPDNSPPFQLPSGHPLAAALVHGTGRRAEQASFGDDHGGRSVPAVAV